MPFILVSFSALHYCSAPASCCSSREYIVPLLNSFRESKDNPKVGVTIPFPSKLTLQPSEYALVCFRDYPPFADYAVQVRYPVRRVAHYSEASPWYSYDRLLQQLKTPAFAGTRWRFLSQQLQMLFSRYLRVTPQ